MLVVQYNIHHLDHQNNILHHLSNNHSYLVKMHNMVHFLNNVVYHLDMFCLELFVKTLFELFLFRSGTSLAICFGSPLELPKMIASSEASMKLAVLLQQVKRIRKDTLGASNLLGTCAARNFIMLGTPN